MASSQTLRQAWPPQISFGGNLLLTHLPTLPRRFEWWDNGHQKNYWALRRTCGRALHNEEYEKHMSFESPFPWRRTACFPPCTLLFKSFSLRVILLTSSVEIFLIASSGMLNHNEGGGLEQSELDCMWSNASSWTMILIPVLVNCHASLELASSCTPPSSVSKICFFCITRTIHGNYLKAQWEASNLFSFRVL